MNYNEIEQYKKILETKPQEYRNFPEEARNSKQITIAALDKDMFNMWYIGNKLKDNADFVKEHLSKYPTFQLNKVSPRLQKDKEMVEYAMGFKKTFGLRDLEHICKHFSDDREFVNKALDKLISDSGLKPMEINEDTILPESLYDESVLQERSGIVAGEIAVGKAMIANYSGVDRAIEMVQDDPNVYRLLNFELQSNKEVIFAAIKKEPYLINALPNTFQNKEFYMEAFKQNPEICNNISDDNPCRMFQKELREHYTKMRLSQIAASRAGTKSILEQRLEAAKEEKMNMKGESKKESKSKDDREERE